MADTFGQNPGGETERAYVPPPPNDVSIRTMESDIKSMALSGGSFARAEKVSAPVSHVQTPPPTAGGSPGSKGLIWLIVLGAIAILAAAGYFVYPLLFPPQNTPVTTPPETSSTQTPTLPEVPVGITLPNFDHKSYLRKAGDAVLDMNVTYTATKLSDLETYSQKIQDLLSGVSVIPSLAEVNARKTGGQSLAFTEFLQFIKSRVFDQNFLINNFEPDFTFFVYKDKDGLWPGYILKPKQGKNWLILKPEVAKIESSSDLASLFITDPGSQIDTFKDVFISGQSARTLKYSKTPANLIYGLFHDYLVISTSEAGLKDAINRM